MRIDVMEKQKKIGFTLIELLVVVAIIAVLVAILLPALSSARESARQITCAMHMRQSGMGIMYYSEDQGSLPGPCYTGAGDPDDYPPNASYYSLCGALMGATHSLPRNTELFACPSVPDKRINDANAGSAFACNTSNWKTDGGVDPDAPNSCYRPRDPGFRKWCFNAYGNYAYTAYGGFQPAHPPRKQSELDGNFSVGPDQIWLVRDYYPWHGAKTAEIKVFTFWHGSESLTVAFNFGIGRNLLCADGHVEKTTGIRNVYWWERSK